MSTHAIHELAQVIIDDDASGHYARKLETYVLQLRIGQIKRAQIRVSSSKEKRQKRPPTMGLDDDGDAYDYWQWLGQKRQGQRDGAKEAAGAPGAYAQEAPFSSSSETEEDPQPNWATQEQGFLVGEFDQKAYFHCDHATQHE